MGAQMNIQEGFKRSYLQISVFLFTLWLLNTAGKFIGKLLGFSFGDVFTSLLVYIFWLVIMVLSIIAAKELTKR